MNKIISIVLFSIIALSWANFALPEKIVREIPRYNYKTVTKVITVYETKVIKVKELECKGVKFAIKGDTVIITSDTVPIKIDNKSSITKEVPIKIID